MIAATTRRTAPAARRVARPPRGWWLGASLAATLSGCTLLPEPPAPRPPVATLGGRALTADQLLTVARARSGAGEFPGSGAGFEALRDRLLKDLVVEEIFLVEADARGIALPSGDLDAAEASARESLGAGAEAAVSERFGSAAAHREYLRRRLLSEISEDAVRRELSDGLEIKPEQVESARGRMSADLVEPPRLRARQIWAGDAETIRVAWLRLGEGDAFAAVATDVGGDDGDLGWMTLESAPAVLVDAVADLEPGGFSEVVHSPLGYHIFQLVGRQAEAPVDPAEATRRIEETLRAETAESRLRAWLAGRSDDLGLTVDEDAVARLRCCRRGLPYEEPPAGEDER